MRTRPARGFSAAVVAVALAIPVLAAGCGGDDERANTLRPPSAVNVAVGIGEDRVTVSPPKVGAGPLNLIISNQSGASHQVTIDGPRVRRSVGPINPEDTASLKVTVTPGKYTISTDDSASVQPARLVVGPKRPSGQNQLLLP